MHELDRLSVSSSAIAAIAREFGVRELSVFGSVLRDDFRPDSDVDFLVEFLPDQRVSLFTLIRLQHRLEDVLGRRVDLVPRDGLKPAVRAEVLAKARRVYAA
ncbi:MAG: nucleotidyltransferase family protein [Planctomycetes bacterium]|nr:nucleotidyltransferase family protein [Planctomycetota bacterium]